MKMTRFANKLRSANLLLRWTFLALLSTAACAASDTTSAANGDVRLGTVDQFDVWKGELQIYLDGMWGLVCSAGFNNGSADAACREIGRTQHRRWSTLKEMNVNSTLRILLSNVQCPEVANPVNNGQLHLLRCNYSTNIDSSCTPDNSVWLECDNTSLIEDPYNTQVMLFNINIDVPQTPSSGILQIEINGNLSHVCYDGFNRSAGDTACRQLGFTNAIAVNAMSMISQTPISGLQGSDVSCHAPLPSCINQCLTNPGNVQQTVCTENSTVHLACTFDINTAGSNPSGSFKECNLVIPVGINVAVLAGVFILLGIFLIGGAAIVLVICFFFKYCPLYIKRKRISYRGIV